MKAMVTWEFDNVRYTETVDLLEDDVHLLTVDPFGFMVAITTDQVYKQYPKLVFFVGDEGNVFGLQTENIKDIKRLVE